MLGGVFRETDSLITQRRRQIDTLKIFNANVSEVKPDCEYRVELVSAGGQPLAVCVSLPADFPLPGRPALRVVPPVRHPWLDDAGRVTSAPGLLNFSALSDLGRVVQAIVRELQLRHTSPSPSPPPPPLTPQVEPIAAAPSVATAHLSSLSVAELEELAGGGGASRLDEWVAAEPGLRRLEDAIDHLIDANQRLAESTLSSEERVAALRGEVGQRRAELRARHGALAAVHSQLAHRYSPHTIREQLRAAVGRGEEESERVAERFLGGQLDLPSFLSQYTRLRTLNYCRKTKEEKLSHQLAELHRAGF